MDPAVFRKLTYGMYAVGTLDGTRPTGCIVNTVEQVTSKNPVIVLSMNKNNFTYEAMIKTGRFSVSILSENVPQPVISVLGFRSGRTEDKFDGKEVPFQIVDGLPVITSGICGWMTAEIIAEKNCGTHSVILARVTDAKAVSDEPPMTYAFYHSERKGTAPKNAPTWQPLPDGPQSEEIWVCPVCGYTYRGDLTKEPDSWTCPICGVPKSRFTKQNSAGPDSPNAGKETWTCPICGYVYHGDLTKEPDDWVCPLCGAPKNVFKKKS